jgi:hypothetical protein
MNSVTNYELCHEPEPCHQPELCYATLNSVTNPEGLFDAKQFMRYQYLGGGGFALAWCVLVAGVGPSFWPWVRCALPGRILHSRMPLDPTHARLKLLHACDQCHSSRESTPLTVVIMNYVETRKVELSSADWTCFFTLAIVVHGARL